MSKTIGTCGKCNQPATVRMTDGYAIVKACDTHKDLLLAQGWKVRE